VQPSGDSRIDTWSDDELLDQYRRLTGESGNGTETGDSGQLQNVRDEMERRGLSADGQGSALNEPGSQSDQGESVIDPSSGAVPPAG
jgi:hypothetical protein